MYDFRYFTRRFMKRCPGLARRKVRAISAQECEQYIEMAFDTPRQCRVRHCGEAGLVQRESGGEGGGTAGGGEAGADSHAADADSAGALSGGWGEGMPGELVAALAGAASRSGVGWC